MHEIGNRIKRHRKELGLSQEQLAHLLEISRNHLSGIESGKYLITTSTLIKLYNLYGKTPDYYLIGRISPDINKVTRLIAQLSSEEQELLFLLLSDHINRKK